MRRSPRTWKWHKFVLVLLGTAGCAARAPDPDHGVTSASYRQVIERAQVNVAQITSKLLELRDEDMPARGTTPLRPTSWWSAEIRNATTTRNMLADALAGANR